jgi:hypothetical protein
MENREDPILEMKRRFRQIGGIKGIGEADVHVRNRAQRRVNGMLPKNKHISDRTAYALWHGEKAEIPSHLMDVVRALTNPRPTIEQKLSAFIEASQQVEHALVTQRQALEAELATAREWQAFDRQQGANLLASGPDRRRAMQAVRRTVAASLLLKSNPDSESSSLIAAE